MPDPSPAPTADPAPRLRPGVTCDPAARTLEDPLFARRVRLDDAGLAIVAALPVATSTADLAAQTNLPPSRVATWLGRLADLDLLDAPRAEARAEDRAALNAVRADPASHLRPLQGARFSCTMCGSCCGGHLVGPVSAPILASLEPHLPALEAEIRAERRVAKGLFFLKPGQRATPGEDVVCHAAAGSCVFLDDVGLCRIHRRLGAGQKPLPCRIFPYELTASPSGVRVAILRECRDFLAATSPEKPTLADSLDEVQAFLPELARLPVTTLTPRVRDTALDRWSDYEALEAQLLHACEADSAEGAFRALAACIDAVAPAPVASEPSFSAWRDALLAPLRQMLAAVPEADAEVVFRVDGLALAVEALAEARGWLLARATAPLEGEARRLLTAHLRHALWSLSPLRASSVAAGLGRLHAEWLLARLIALVRARAVKRFHVTVQDLQDGLATATFLFRHKDLEPLLAHLDPLTTAIFLDAPHLPRTEADREPDARTELAKF
jgi:Fe-S-cluster containining protein